MEKKKEASVNLNCVMFADMYKLVLQRKKCPTEKHGFGELKLDNAKMKE